MATPRSHVLSDAFGLNLPADVKSWLDLEIWNRQSDSNFSEGLAPEESIRLVWGGLMLPDSLPILGNACGDCLSLRFRPDGRVNDVIRWYHEGSFWNPMGESLSEALVFDAAKTVEDGGRPECLDFAEWSLQWLPHRSEDLLVFFEKGPYEALLEHGLAQSGVHRELCERCCTSKLMAFSTQDFGGQGLADRMNVDWPTVQEWFFDTKSVSADDSVRLTKIFDLNIDDLLFQDWEQAADEAQRACVLHPELAWTHAVMGWAAERSGQIEKAVGCYALGLTAPATTAEFTDAWRLTGDRTAFKFAADRLISLESSLPSSIRDSPYFTAARRRADGDFDAIRNFWLKRAEQSQGNGKYAEAYRFLVNAGWDDFCFDHMEGILERLAESAQSMGSIALRRLADHHRKCLAR